MADAVEIYIDVSTPQGRMVKSLDSQATLTIGPFYQGSVIPMRVWPVISTGATVSGPFFSKLPLTTLDFQLVLGPRAGSESILAAQYTWTKQVAVDSEGKSGYFYANFDLNTTALNTAIGSADTYDSAYLEFRLSRAGANYTPIFQFKPSILAVVKDPASASSTPTPTPSYLTRDECFNLFVMWNNTSAPGGANNGRNIILASPDGTHTRELGVGDDSSPIDNAT